MACANIKSISYDACAANVGGVKNVWLANFSAEAVKSYSKEGEDNTAIATLDGDMMWYNYPMRKNTASMTSTLNVADNGSSYVSTVLSMAFNRMDTEKRMAMTAMILSEVCAVVEDANGEMWFLGAENPVATSAGTGVTGQQKSDVNQYTLEVTDESAGFPFALVSDLKAKFHAIGSEGGKITA